MWRGSSIIWVIVWGEICEVIVVNMVIIVVIILIKIILILVAVPKLRIFNIYCLFVVKR